MFPNPTSRFRTAMRRSLDAAIDFATLGEYGWSAAWDAPDAGVPDGGSLAVAERPVAQVLRPVSAAGRARLNAETREAPRCAGQPLRSRALEPALPRASRSRDGMAPREQHCVADAA